MECCNSPLSASLLRLTLIQLSHKESLFVADGTLETDYLVIGGGATAMAFVDTLLDETDAPDRDGRPAMTIPVAIGTTHTPSSAFTSRRPTTVSAHGSSAAV